MHGENLKTEQVPDPLLVELAIERLLGKTMLDALKECKWSIDWWNATVYSRNWNLEKKSNVRTLGYRVMIKQNVY